MRSIIISLLSLVLLTSCEGNQVARGTVADYMTGKKLDSVVVTSYSRKNGKNKFESEMFSDEKGAWKASTGMKGCITGCPHLLVIFSKNGYRSRSMEDPGEDTQVTLEK